MITTQQENNAERMKRILDYLTALRELTGALSDSLDRGDIENCPVILLKRQEYIRYLGTLFLSGGEGASSMADRQSGLNIADAGYHEKAKNIIQEIQTLDKSCEERLIAAKKTMARQMEEMSGARQYLRHSIRTSPDQSRFVDIVES
jgi:hypothetical protein